jgi:hypothetical protein
VDSREKSAELNNEELIWNSGTQEKRAELQKTTRNPKMTATALHSFLSWLARQLLRSRYG